MKYISDINISQNKPSVVTLGNFDGLHLGHRKLIRTVQEISRDSNYQSIVFSFYPHPQIVLKKGNLAGMIFSRYEKKNRLEKMGIDTYIEYPFTKEFADIPPEEFVEDILLKKLNTKVIVIGSNNRFGRKQQGNVAFLKEREKKWGITVVEISPISYKGKTVSSTRVRKELMGGNIRSVNELLEDPYIIIGKVIEGKKLGRTFGYPTANILAENDRIYPPNGVYITKTKCKDNVFTSVTNIGCNPTVNGEKRSIETYINDFNGDLYDKTLEIEFFKWIRKEQKFSSIDQLIAQLGIDVKLSREYFADF